MAKDPAFLFYASDFISGVSDLTMEERGQYITLLCLQHQKGIVSEKTIRLNLGSVSVEVLAKFTKDELGNYYNNRLRQEIEKRAAFTESRRNNGVKGGRPKASDKPNGYPNGKPKNNHIEDRNENKDIVSKENITELSETEKQQAFEFVFRLGRKEITKPDITNFWEAFKTHKPESFKETRSRQMQHFRDWLKFQKKDNGTTKTKLGTSAARIEALKNW